MTDSNNRNLRSRLRELKEAELTARKEINDLIVKSTELEYASATELQEFASQFVAARQRFEAENRELTAYYVHTDGTPEGIREGNLTRKQRYHILHTEAREAMNFLNEWLAGSQLDPIDDINSVISHPSVFTNYGKGNVPEATDSEKDANKRDDASLLSQAMGGVDISGKPTTFHNIVKSKKFVPSLHASHSVHGSEPKKSHHSSSSPDHDAFKTPMHTNVPPLRTPVKAHSIQGPNHNYGLLVPLQFNQLYPQANAVRAPPQQPPANNNLLQSSQGRPLLGQGPPIINNPAQNIRPQLPRSSNVQFAPPNPVTPVQPHQIPPQGAGTQSQPSQHQYAHNVDPSTRYRLRCELLQGLGEPFDGKAEFFAQWHTTLNKRILECGQECDSLDAINIIIANTAGNVKETVKRLLSAGISDPDSTLARIWETIQDRYGSTEDLSDSLIHQLENLKPVTNVTDINGLHNILDTCTIVESHMLVYNDLKYLNFKRGLQIVVDVLPDKLKTRWKECSFKHKNNTGLEVDFSFFVNFLVQETKYWKAQAPAISKSTKTPNTITHNKKQYKAHATKVDTDIKHKQVDKKGKFCKFHKFTGHTIEECVGFELQSYESRKRFAIENALCFVCLGTHRAQDCDKKASIKCRVCESSHVTAMHRGTIPKLPRAGHPGGGNNPSHRDRQASSSTEGGGSTTRRSQGSGGSSPPQAPAGDRQPRDCCSYSISIAG